MSASDQSPPPQLRQAFRYLESDTHNAELHVTTEDEAGSLLWAAQWLDEHREYSVTGIRLDYGSNRDDEDCTTTVVVSLHRAHTRRPARLGPWVRAVPPLWLKDS
jgi:hypothetical protein